MPTSHDATESQRFVLQQTLTLAVPLHMHDLRHCDPNFLAEIASQAATTIGSHGDALQFGGKQCAPAFNALARGLAATALSAWGGATFQDLHWCTGPHCAGPDGDHPQPVNPNPVPAAFTSPLNDRPIVDLDLPQPTSEEAA